MKKHLIAAAILAAITSNAALAHDTSEDKNEGREKCYGIAKAGKNDCASKDGKNGCAGTAEKAGGWVYVPKGLCDRLIGGSLN